MSDCHSTDEQLLLVVVLVIDAASCRRVVPLVGRMVEQASMRVGEAGMVQHLEALPAY